MDCVKEYRKGIGIFWRSNIYSKVYGWRYNCWTRYIGSGRPTLNFQIMIYVGGKNLGTIPVVGYYDHISYPWGDDADKYSYDEGTLRGDIIMGSELQDNGFDSLNTFDMFMESVTEGDPKDNDPRHDTILMIPQKPDAWKEEWRDTFTQDGLCVIFDITLMIKITVQQLMIWIVEMDAS